MTLLSGSLLLAMTGYLAWRLTARMRGYAMEHLLDQPTVRSSHAVPTPRGGGLATVFAFSLAVLILAASGDLHPREAWALVGGGGLVAAVGFWDDHGHISASWRLLAHVIAATWAVANLGGLAHLSLNGTDLSLGWVGGVLAILFLVWMTNLFNFMDGIDGLAGSEVVFLGAAGACLALFQGEAHALLFALLGAASGGFLIWNWPPARIFMGDVGSGFVGYIIGVFALVSANAGQISLVVWLMLAAVFIVDATLTLARRVIDGQRCWEAHRSHAYQQAAARWGHRQVTLGVVLINVVWLIPLAFAANTWPRHELILLVGAYLPLVILGYALKAGRVG